MEIKGQTVKLHIKTSSGQDPFGNETFIETIEEVENVLCEPASNDAVVAELQLSGKHVVYILHIPKGDTHNWEDTIVEFNGKTWRTFGDCLIYDEKMTPLSWNKKIKVERYE